MRTHINILFAIACIFAFSTANAQISFGGGASTLKVLAKNYERPFQLGATFKLGIDVGEKAQIVLTPTYFFPANYSSMPASSTDSPLPDVIEQTTRLKVFTASALVTYNLYGTTHSPASVYIGAGPGFSTYNIDVVGDGKNEGVDVYSASSDLILDMRFGGEWEFLEPLRLYAEVAVAPILATNIEEGVDDLRTRGTMLFPSMGIRIPLGPHYE